MMTILNQETLHNLEQALHLEWLETDGLGGYACGTVVGARTRRYHALLMAATQPPVGRRLLVAGLEERLHVDGRAIQLGCNIYDNVIYPQGYRFLESFSQTPWPVFTWATDGLCLRKSIFMPHRLGVTVVRYDLLEAPSATWLSIRPLIADRDMHHLQRAEGNYNPEITLKPHLLLMHNEDPIARLVLQYPGGEFQSDGLWYYDFHYSREAERGLDYIDDLYSPGEMAWLLRPGETAWLIMGREPITDFDGDMLMMTERLRRETLTDGIVNDPVGKQLTIAADQFLVDRELSGQHYRSVIAGYPWFGDWGRDTMIALPGLTLATGWYDDFASTLRAYVANMRDGLIPNNFGENGDPAYNTVDATLWMFVAIYHHYQATGSLDLVMELWPALETALSAHIEGIAIGIRCDTDGLLLAGDATTQLTWMDAKVGDWVVTPRHGKAIEVNALWVNALHIADSFSKQLNNVKSVYQWGLLANKANVGFEQFWNEELGYCYDCLRPEGSDDALRPNQLLALSLPHPLLSRERGRRILQAVTKHLLTPYGLRTLAPGSPGYVAHYGGDVWARDGAYHQGTVWPWLMGPYLGAYFHVYGISETTRRYARELLQPLLNHLDQAGLGSISEIFDAEPPYVPNGCFAQAWSVAEILRVWVEYRLAEA